MRLNGKLWENENGIIGGTQLIGAIVGLLVTLIVAVLIFYNIAGSIDTSKIDEKFTGTPATNATQGVMSQAQVVFQLLPIVAIVMVAAVVIYYVTGVGGA